MIVDTEDPMFDFASIEASLADVNYAIKEAKYDSEMDGATVQFANGRRPVGRTLGREKCTCSITMFKSQSVKFFKALGPGFSLKIFPIIVKYSVPGSDIITDSIMQCRVTKRGGGGSEGGDGLTEEITIQPMGILWNGLSMVGEALTA